MELLGDASHVESYFGLFGDGVSISADIGTVCVKHSIPSEIVFDTHDGTPR
jgi:hypothetical protein